MRRRGVLGGLLGGVAALALAAAGGAAWKFHLFGPHYPPTPYDDLLNQITDRAPAITLGRAALKSMPGANAAALARTLRSGHGDLAERAPRDLADGRVAEVGGWLVPQSVAAYAALAASV